MDWSHTPRVLSMQEIVKLPSKSLKVVLECSGDKRKLTWVYSQSYPIIIFI